MSHMLLVVFTQRWDKHTHAHTHADARKEQKKILFLLKSLISPLKKEKSRWIEEKYKKGIDWLESYDSRKRIGENSFYGTVGRAGLEGGHHLNVRDSTARVNWYFSKRIKKMNFSCKQKGREKQVFFLCVLFNISIIIALCLNWRYRRTDGDPARKNAERERNVIIIIIKWFLVLVHVFFCLFLFLFFSSSHSK